MSYLWVAVGQAQSRGRLRELADDSDKNWIATPKGRKRKKPDGTWQYDYTKPGTGKKAAVAKKPTPKKAGSKTMKKEGQVKSYKVNGKEPWEMTAREWENAANEFVGDGMGGGAGRVGTQTANRMRHQQKRHLDRMAMLRMDLPSVVDEDGILATRSPGHREVVEAAVAAGLPVPESVLAEYPSLMEKQIDGAIVDDLQQMLRKKPLENSPLPDLYKRISAGRNITVEMFHDALLRLWRQKKIRLVHFTQPHYTIPDKRFAMTDVDAGKRHGSEPNEPFYYAAAKG